jgi:hypothetical protein
LDLASGASILRLKSFLFVALGDTCVKDEKRKVGERVLANSRASCGV